MAKKSKQTIALRKYSFRSQQRLKQIQRYISKEMKRAKENKSFYGGRCKTIKELKEYNVVKTKKKVQKYANKQ